MNDEIARSIESEPGQGMSSLYRLFEAFIALRERNERQHKLFETNQNRSRDSMQENFNSFAAQTQKAYQQMRQEFLGEKKVSLTVLTELLDVAQELEHIVANKPEIPPELSDLTRWAEAVEVEFRKVQAALARQGVHPYDAIVGSPYNPALHERVGSVRVDGYEGLRIAEQKERGYASQLPDFVLRRPKVLVTE